MVLRLITALIALVAIIYLALSLRVVDLQLQAQGAFESGTKPSIGDLKRGRSAAERASRLTPDTDPLFQIAFAQLALGARSDAQRTLRRVVAREPQNFEGWAAIASLTSSSSDSLAIEARRRVRQLNPLLADRIL